MSISREWDYTRSGLLRCGAGSDALFGGPGAEGIDSVGDGAGDLVDCGAGTDAVKKGPDRGSDRFVDRERFVN